MRILVAHLADAARSGGMSRLMGRVHDELSARGHQVTYLTADDVPAAVRGGAGRFLFALLVRRAVTAAARRGEPIDVVNVHEPHGAAVAAVRTGLAGTAVIAMTHGVEQRGWEVAQGHAPARPRLKSRLLYPLTSLPLCRVTLANADHIICLNRQDRDFLRDRFGIDPSHVTSVFPGADPVFGMAAAARTHEHGRRLVFAGTWLPRKGVAELAAAFGSLVERGLNVSLDVVGAGVPTATVLGAFSARAGARVCTVECANDSMTAAALAGADIFVLPSIFEGTPLTLIEAMWSGLPIITTRTAGMQDVVTDGRSGLLVPPADVPALAAAIARLVGDRDLRESLGREAHRVASSRYTWPNAAATFETAYRAACSRHASRAH